MAIKPKTAMERMADMKGGLFESIGQTVVWKFSKPLAGEWVFSASLTADDQERIRQRAYDIAFESEVDPEKPSQSKTLTRQQVLESVAKATICVRTKGWSGPAFELSETVRDPSTGLTWTKGSVPDPTDYFIGQLHPNILAAAEEFLSSHEPFREDGTRVEAVRDDGEGAPPTKNQRGHTAGSAE